MADDEVLVPIEKAFWPKGVLRGLNPLLRELGDKHGNLVIAAVPNKHIMLKGPADRIADAKPGLRKLIEEHFPDAPIPESLAEEEPPAPAPEPPKPKAAAKPAKPAEEPAKPAAAAAAAGGGGIRAAIASRLGVSKASAAPEKAPVKPVAGRKRPRPAVATPASLLWECTRKNSSFIRKGLRQCGTRPFSAEPMNLLGVHAARFSGVAATEAVDVRPKKEGDKESIVLMQSHSKASRKSRPSKATLEIGLSKCPKKGLELLNTELNSKFYCKALSKVAEKKYMKVQKSFKKKKVAAKSRRIKA